MIAPSPPDEAAAVESAAALRRYTDRIRRQRVVYFGILAVVVIAIGVLVTIAYEHGEAAHTTLHTVKHAPPSVSIAVPSPTQQLAWSTSDRTAIGAPQWGGTIVTFDKRTVRGRDARTGTATWSYTRSDRTVCTAVQTGGVTIAIYELHGNCDEVTALDSGTGTRRWTRTLDLNGMPVEGHPQYQVGPDNVLVYTKSVIYSIDPGSGEDHWEFQQPGCTIDRAVLGDLGVLISQDCAHPNCTDGLKFCGRGPQLLMRNAINGRDDKSNSNPDQILWNEIGNTDVPVSADGLTSALNRTTHALDTLDPASGKSRGSIAIAPAPASLTRTSAISTVDTEVVWLDGTTYAIQPGATRPLWRTGTPAPPTVVSATGEDTLSLPTARVTVATGTGVRLIDGNRGRTAETFTLPTPPPAGSVAYSLGTGFLISWRGGTAAYR